MNQLDNVTVSSSARAETIFTECVKQRAPCRPNKFCGIFSCTRGKPAFGVIKKVGKTGKFVTLGSTGIVTS